MKIAVAFTGPSNSGKTTLITKLANSLIQDYKVAIVKHDPKDKAEFDKVGKDSDIFFKTGAEVVVTSPLRTTYFSHKKRGIKEIIKMLESDFDILLVEGLKEIELPRIAIFRGEIEVSYLPYSNAIAVDNTISKEFLPKDIKILNLNNSKEIIEWIKENAKYKD